MSAPAFLDPPHVLALLNPRDAWHARAVSASQAAPERLVTTEQAGFRALLREVG